MTHEHASDDDRSVRRLFGIALVAFVAFPGTLTALGSGLVMLYASPPTFATPGATVLFTALTVCAGGTIVAHQLLNP